MNTKEIAHELLKNSTNVHLKAFIETYISHLPSLEQETCNEMGLVRLHRCITYLHQTNFDVTGWMMFEIPSYESHCFLNEQTDGFFDLAVFEDKHVEPQYLDGNGYLQKAETIEEAINKYILPDLPEN